MPQRVRRRAMVTGTERKGTRQATATATERRPQATTGYFSDALIEVNLVLRLLPRLLTAATITMLIPVAIRQYSIAVAPDSLLRNLEIS
jgi:hypothetical protein